MKKTITLILILLISNIVYSENINEEKKKDKLISAILKSDYNYISNAFAPKIFFQYVTKTDEFKNNDFIEFNKSKGKLFKVFYDSEYMKKKFSKNIVCLSEVLKNDSQLSISIDEDDTVRISSITAYYKNYFYDIVLNSNDKNQCEIVGININPASNLNSFLLSSISTSNSNYLRLIERINLEESRKWHESGIIQLHLNKERSKGIYGPNRKFQILYAGSDNDVGGVVYLLADNNIILFQHLTSLNKQIVDATNNKIVLEPGVFIGNATKQIGISEKNNYINIQGRSINGSLLTVEEIIRILSGK